MGHQSSWQLEVRSRSKFATESRENCMGHRNREIEVKLLVPRDLATVCLELRNVLRELSPVERIGSSTDTYWAVRDESVDGDFLRVRERDGIRQITVKGRDRVGPDGELTNTNRIEVDIDSTSDTRKIHRLFRCLLGKPAGIISKRYTVWELESEYDTVCAYEVDTPLNNLGVMVEVEARTEQRMLELEKLVTGHFQQKYGTVPQRAPGSLFEMFISRTVKLPSRS